jgi:GT2 family glycosyltransferase
MSEAKAAVVILTYNNKGFLERFLHGIIRHSYPHEVIVADNGSSDGTSSFLREQFPQVRLIENGGNFGYPKGYNYALRQVSADYFILLNSDVEVTPGWIGPMLSLLEHDPWIAACQPKLLDEADRGKFEYAGASGGFIDKYGYPFCRGRLFNTLEADTGQYDDPREVFWASGACLFVRAKAFWHAGGLDDSFFAHMEEIDLCWRLKNFGYRIYVQPASVVYHVGGGTLSKISSRKTYLNFRNNLTTLCKNHPSSGLFSKLLYRLVLDAVAGLKFLFEGHPLHLLAVVRAHFSFYGRLGRIAAQRRALKNAGGCTFRSTGLYNGNVVYEYFLRGKRSFRELNSGFISE